MPKSWITRGAETAERMRRVMQLRGETPNGYPLWDRPETGTLIDGYPDYRSVKAELDRRTLKACHSKAGRLKITRPRGKRWNDNELLRLGRYYRTGTREEILAAFPGRSWAAISKRANARGLRRERPAPKPTGIPLVDQILWRAWERKWTLRDLDEVCNAPGYFTQHKWRSSGIKRLAILHAAVRALGGQLRARFRR